MKKLAKVVLTMSVLLSVFVGGKFASAAGVEDEIVTTSKTLIGTPYKFGGTSKNGFDCSGFLQYVFNKEGIKLPRSAAEQYRVGTPVSKKELEAGDVVFFETYKEGPSHTGIYVGDNKFIHASSSKGVAISSLNDKYYWEDRYIGAKRFVKDTPKIASVEIRKIKR